MGQKELENHVHSTFDLQTHKTIRQGMVGNIENIYTKSKNIRLINDYLKDIIREKLYSYLSVQLTQNTGDAIVHPVS